MTLHSPAYRVVQLKYKTPCWIWQRCISKKGYGMIKLNGSAVLAHRVYYERFKGPIPEDLTIDHLCFNADCVNPDHLEAVTFKENRQRVPHSGTKHSG